MEGKDTSPLQQLYCCFSCKQGSQSSHIELKLIGLRANLFPNTEANRVYMQSVIFTTLK